MNGIIIYKKNEVSFDYISWLINDFKKENLNLTLVYLEDFLINGYNKKIDFVINKTRNSSISYMFELNGIRVLNNSFVTELSNNKLKGYNYAKKIGIETADILIKKQADKFIRKQIDGHGGDNVFLTDKGFIDNENYLCQKFIENVIGDIRFFVVGNKIINACIRRNKDNFLHNYKKGAEIELYNIDQKSEKLINLFLKDIKFDFVGIDFLLLENGKLIFNEIEDVCGSKMLSALGVNNTTYEFLNYIKNF